MWEEPATLLQAPREPPGQTHHRDPSPCRLPRFAGPAHGPCRAGKGVFRRQPNLPHDLQAGNSCRLCCGRRGCRLCPGRAPTPGGGQESNTLGGAHGRGWAPRYTQQGARGTQCDVKLSGCLSWSLAPKGTCSASASPEAPPWASRRLWAGNHFDPQSPGFG